MYGDTDGCRFGHAKITSKSLLVRRLNVLAATVSAPLAAPVVAAARLRGGNAGSARGGHPGGGGDHHGPAGPGLRLDRGARGFRVLRGGVRGRVPPQRGPFSVTVRMDPKVKRNIAAIPDQAWTAIKYPNAIYDEQTGKSISDAEIAECPTPRSPPHAPTAPTAG